jgi:hypothetical protein
VTPSKKETKKWAYVTNLGLMLCSMTSELPKKMPQMTRTSHQMPIKALYKAYVTFNQKKKIVGIECTEPSSKVSAKNSKPSEREIPRMLTSSTSLMINQSQIKAKIT